MNRSINRVRRGVPHFLSHWEHIAARIRTSHRIALFLDFDGTLVRIAPRPNRVRLVAATRRILRRLANHPRVIITVISGRRRAELLQYIGIRNIRYLGLYGWENGRKARIPASSRVALRRVQCQLEVCLAAFPGVWTENKRNSLSIHLLSAQPAVQRRARRELRTLVHPFQLDLRLFENLRDMEIVPRSNQGKGIALRRLLSQPAFRRTLPLYFGDDLSDEAAFWAVRRGFSVHIGDARRTCARYFVRNPGEVTLALRRLEAALA